MLLDKQCEKLGIPLIDKTLTYTGRPELAILEYFKQKGYTGIHCEGGTMLMLLKACMLNGLIKYNIFNDRKDAINRHLEAQLTILDDKKEELIELIKLTPKGGIFDNFSSIINSDFIRHIYPSLSIRTGEVMFDTVGREKLFELAKVFAANPYQYRSGWPDLTLIRDKSIKFVEVKTTDNLHKSQLTTIPVILDVLPNTIVVCRVKRIIN
ncbi:VRR-NUC domain-containing protein [Salmonella enterica]|nr:VRR-NUC domain-containing protein [Salmonella enterica subsp. enterica serovar Oranienburg]EIB0268732.1 VRR-NUC domain-containing protein [Salmonella enterica]